MAKKKNAPKEELPKKPYIIIGAKMRDSFCDYTFEVQTGTGIGDKHTVKGAGIATDDLVNAFSAMHKHVACIDDIFKHNGVEISNIDKMANNELTSYYHVDGFKIHGSDENESISFVGSKALSVGGRASFETPRIGMDSLSAYKWYNELKEASDNLRNEVELYREGKVVLNDEEFETDANQLSLVSDSDFSNAKHD